MSALHLLADTAQHLAGHVLAYAPTPDPGPTPGDMPVGDPTAPHNLHLGKILWYLIAFVGSILVVMAGVGIMAKGGIKGDLNRAISMSAGTALGVGVVVLGATGLVFGIGFFLASGI